MLNVSLRPVVQKTGNVFEKNTFFQIFEIIVGLYLSFFG